MMHKYARSLLPSGHTHPYLVEYYRFTVVDNQASHVFRNLANRQNLRATFTNFACTSGSTTGGGCN